MRAVRYGVTRQHVLGLEIVLADGRVLRTGGKYVKSSSGYDLTQLLIGSEGTLAVTTEVIVKVQPRPTETTTVLVPFATLAEVTHAVPRIVASGVNPTILEYADALVLGSITRAAGLDLGIPQEVQQQALAYLIVVLEQSSESRLDEDVEQLGTLLGELGALDVYVLPPQAGASLITARERLFFVSKAAGCDDIIDAVIPRAAIPDYLTKVAEVAAANDTFVSGCGHVGDGNVHLAVFQPDVEKRKKLTHEIFQIAVEAGGAISGEHGLGTEKMPYFLEMADPAALELMRAIKKAFDPLGILGPDRVLGASDPGATS
jgi:glycolate oxidase